MKPGAMARLGLSWPAMQGINPRLVYCAVTGFGTDSPYGERAAMDTTIQGMAGVMDLTRASDVPFKTGISLCDLIGGQMALAAILAALERRDRCGAGQFLDLAMLDVSAWLTQLEWNSPTDDERVTTMCCSDGWLAVELTGLNAQADIAVALLAERGTRETRSTAARSLERHGVRSAPVLSVREAMHSEQSTARGLMTSGRTARGVEWPLLACPMRFSRTPAQVRRAIGAVGTDRAEILADWELPGA